MLKNLFFSMVIVLIGYSQIFAQSDKIVVETVAPWDTVLAEIQIVEQISAVDSIKSQLLKGLFERYQITEDDYQKFYENFMKQPVQFQQQFLDRVKEILIAQGKNPKQQMK